MKKYRLIIDGMEQGEYKRHKDAYAVAMEYLNNGWYIGRISEFTGVIVFDFDILAL